MTEVKSTKKWYVIRSVSGKENKIKEYIESEIIRLNLQNHIEQILVPTEKVVQIRNGKKNKQGTSFYSWLYYGASRFGR
jgi:transcriptional antiterminator NusG